MQDKHSFLLGLVSREKQLAVKLIFSLSSLHIHTIYAPYDNAAPSKMANILHDTFHSPYYQSTPPYTI